MITLYVIIRLINKIKRHVVMKNTDKQNYEMIAHLCDAFGPSGFEDEVIKAARQYVTFYDTFTDKMKNFYIFPYEQNETYPTVMLDAHSDEVGFMIHSVKPDGTLGFVTLGPISKECLASSELVVRNTQGEYLSAVISTVSPHYDKNASFIKDTELCIDIGSISASQTKETYHVQMGEPAGFSTICKINEQTGTLIGKAFDCRLGCAALIETINRLEGENLKVNVKGVLSSQEEVGARGAKASVRRILPDIAICFEGCPADDTIAQDYAQQTKMGFGPMLRYIDGGMITNPAFMRFALSVADKYDIPVQTAVRTGSMTDALSIHTEKNGIPTIVIGIPVRYTHSPSCIANYEDYLNAVSLAKAIISELSKEIIEDF